MSAKLRPIAGTQLRVFPLCLGGNVFGWTADERRSFAVLDAYLAAGGNFLDTAAQYSNWAPGNEGGESERTIGRWLARRRDRDDMVVATKVGHMGRVGVPGGLRREYVLAETEASLGRLGLDHVDLLYAHYDDPGTELEETIAAFDEIVRAGKARYIAASNYSAPRLAAALATADRLGSARYTVLQTYYNLLERERLEGDLAEVCAENGIECIAFWALAKGYLTGKYSGRAVDSERGVSDRAERHSVREVADPRRAAAVLACLTEIAAEQHTNPAAVSLAWTAAQPGILAPVASARTVAQLSDLLEMTAVELSPADLRRLDDVSKTQRSAA